MRPLQQSTDPVPVTILRAIVIPIVIASILFDPVRPAPAQNKPQDFLPPPPPANVKIVGPNPDAHIGGFGVAGDFRGMSPARLLAVGDFNGDGILDIAIGAPEQGTISSSHPGAGAVYVVFGRTSLPAEIELATAADLTILGSVPGDHLGYSLAAADINGDGFTDLIIGAPDASSPSQIPSGAVCVIKGSRGLAGVIDLATAPNDVLTIYGPSLGGRFGAAVAAGDAGGPTINSKPIADLIIGAPGSPLSPGPGSAYLFFGKPSTFSREMIDLSSSQADFTLQGQGTSGLGTSVAIADIDGDGFGDMFAGAPGADRPARLDADIGPAQGTGAVFGVFGPIPTASPVQASSDAPFSFFGYGPGERFGISLATGDVTGDGIADLVVGAAGPTGVGGEWRDPLTPNFAIGSFSYESLPSEVIYVLAGDHSFSKKRYDAFAGEWTTAILTYGGRAVSLATGKYDMPGNTGAPQDVLFGVPFFSPGAAIDSFGGGILTSTRTRPRPPWIPSVVDYVGFADQKFITTKGLKAGLGFSVAAADVNGDGAGDMIASAPFASGVGGVECGIVEIWFGIPKPPNPAPTITSVSPAGGPAAGGTSLLILGSNFVTGASLKIGGVDATNVSVASSTLLTAITPPHDPGSVDLVLTNPDGITGTLAKGFAYSGPPAPVITSVTIDGKNLDIIGQNFDIGAVILLNGVDQKTIPDDQNPSTILVGKKVAKQIPRGQPVVLQVRNSTGPISLPFSFLRPDG